MNYLKYTRNVSKDLHPAMKALLLIFRLIFGGVFIFSGFVKAVDPVGTSYKILEYLGLFGGLFEFLSPLALLGAIGLVVAEIVIGINIVFNIRFRLSALGGLLIMLVMTPLTLYIALTNPMEGCGCFGEAVEISNTQTFIKNAILLPIIATLFVFSKRIRPLFAPITEWIITAVFTLIFTIFAVYNIRNLPVIDFLPFKVGVNIFESMPAEERFEIFLIYEKDGVEEVFTLENFPSRDSEWIFVDQKLVPIPQTHQATIAGFIIENELLDDITEYVLVSEGYMYLIIMHDVNTANARAVQKVQKLYERRIRQDITQFYVITASPVADIEAFRERTGVTFPLATSNRATLRDMVRANPGVILLNNGTIENKWHWRNFDWE